MGVLTINLLRVEKLRDADGFGSSDPYVKFQLEQDNMIFDKNFGNQVSSRKNNDLNPEYNETFTFDGLPSLNNMVLRVRIMDDDIGFDDQIGFCVIELENMGLSSQPMEIDRVVDKKRKPCTCNPVTLCLRCCCSLLCCCCGDNKARVYLTLKYDE